MDYRIEQVEGRVNILDERVTDLEREERRTRKRLHELETDRHALALATAAVTSLANKASGSVDSMQEIATTAAQKAIEMDRDERREHAWKTAARVATILGACGGVSYAIFSIAFN